jgi:phosphopantothenoylcysteine decarboxylase/phosphopantothenate--cysteine ligase
MNWKMYEHPIFQANLKRLLSFGIRQVGPETGALACGEEGRGRLAEVPDIVDAVVAAVTPQDLKGLRIIVTAGPTREYLDPVRFLSNRSSGKMGFSVAKAAWNRGAEVVLISGPTALKSPPGVTLIQVDTAAQMLSAVTGETEKNASAVLIMTAAVADFRPAKQARGKIEKGRLNTLLLDRTEDIITRVASQSKKPFIIGFAAETGAHLERAKQKMQRKKMDMIVFNDVTEEGAGFETDTNKVVLMDRKGKTETGLRSKDEIADIILDRYLKIKT